MDDRDTKAVLAVVQRAVAAAPGRKHDLESAMGIGHGRLIDLVNGQLELRSRHLTGLARYLEVPASDFYRLALAESERTSRRRLEEWIDPHAAPPFERRYTEPASSDDRLRTLIREEIAAALSAKR